MNNELWGKSLADGKVQKKLLYHRESTEREGHYKRKNRLMTKSKRLVEELRSALVRGGEDGPRGESIILYLT